MSKPYLTDITWDGFQNSWCLQHGWASVSIHSKLEQDFVAYIVLYKLLYAKRKKEIMKFHVQDRGYHDGTAVLQGGDYGSLFAGYAYLGRFRI